jgi:hypothetical protein
VVQDAGLSSRKQGFDSPWGYYIEYCMEINLVADEADG